MNGCFDAVAFLPPDFGISRAERRLIDSHAGKNILLVVYGSRDKASVVADYLGSSPSSTFTLLCPDSPCSPKLREYIRGRISPAGMTVDVTFATPYYAAAMTTLAAAPGVSVTFTSLAGTTENIITHGGDYSSLDTEDIDIIRSLVGGMKQPSEVVADTGIASKTAYRRLVSLKEKGFISKGPGGRPITYYLDDNQLFLFRIECLGGKADKVPIDPSWVFLDGQKP